MARKIAQAFLTRPLFALDSVDGAITSDTGWREVEGPRLPVTVQPFPFVAVDYESYYTAGYSLGDLTTWEYVFHPSFNAYLVALERFDGQRWRRWVGQPKDAPWEDLRGLEWVSHRAELDEMVSRKLEKDGLIPRGVIPALYHCTADLAAYLQLDRGLDAVAPLLLGETADKSTRRKAKDGGAGAVELRNYAGQDARQCAWIWATHHHLWPEIECYLSRMQRHAGWSGVYLNQPMMLEAKAKMRAVMMEIARKIPWSNREKVTGTKGITLECARRQIPPPPSLSLDDPDTVAWQKTHDRDGWLDNMRRFTKARLIEGQIDLMLSRVRRDGTVPFELVYRKAPHTARWQHTGGLRIQNIDKDEVEGFNARHFLAARPGCSFLIFDLSQIEPRVTNWLVGDEVFLEACRKGQSPYDAHARSTMDYRDPRPLKEFNKGLYALAKARLLALGYQAGAPKFVEMAWDVAQIILFEEECSYSPDLKHFYRAAEIHDRIQRNDLEGWSVFPPAVDSVRDFRDKSPLITAEWERGEREFRKHVGGDYFVPLPNGEVIRYFDVEEKRSYNDQRRRWEGEISAWVIKNSRNPKQKKYLYGGKILENKVQRVSREVLAYHKAEISLFAPRHLWLRWSSHDEIIAECRTENARSLAPEMKRIMSTPPPWAPGLPVACEGAGEDHCGIVQHYIK